MLGSRRLISNTEEITPRTNSIRLDLLSDEEKAIPLRTVDDLVTNNFMTNRGPGNRVYNPTDFDSAYVNVPMMSGIYGGNTSEGAPGAMSFKHNTFRIWGYYGYEKGFLN